MPRKTTQIVFYFLILIVFTGCRTGFQQDNIVVEVFDSGSSIQIETVAGTNVAQVLSANNIQLGALDRVEPPVSHLLSGGERITLYRVREEFTVVDYEIPFEQQILKNESMPEGQSILLQAGSNGKAQTTYRLLFENEVEVSHTIVKTEIIYEATPEKLMIGVKSSYKPVEIEGVIAYITYSNAWIMETTSANRKMVASTGDLDGRVFVLSPDRKWLLYSRSIVEESNDTINSLWLLDITAEEPQPIDTSIRNVMHYADWVPGESYTIAYSTVNPNETHRGWRANNDLILWRFDGEGNEIDKKTLIPANSDGLPDQWSTIFSWSSDGSKLAYARPDSIGTVDLANGELIELLEFEPISAESGLMWIPTISWSPDNNTLFTTLNVAQSPSAPVFELAAFLLEFDQTLRMVPNCGWHCLPSVSTKDKQENYLVGFLSANQTEDNESLSYNLSVMDRDGSNRKRLFPSEGLQGLEPQNIQWSPSSEIRTIAFLAQGNLILVDIQRGNIKQLTGDGMISKITWR